MMKKIVYVQGMHCKSCELILEKSVSQINNVKKVYANQHKGLIEIEYDGNIDQMAIENIIAQNGYKLGVAKNLSWFQNDLSLYVQVFGGAFIIYILYFILQSHGINFSSTNIVGSPTLGIIFIIGLTAGFSSCMALVGGIVLAVSAKINQDKQDLTGWQKFYPHIYFNIGRILGFFVFGAILGAVGTVLNLSVSLLAVFTLIVGVIMFLLGVNLTEISPRLSNISITLPKFLSRGIDENKSKNSVLGAMITGALTFFLPCGFTLAVQMYAMSSGNWMMGGLIMSMFALGTATGLVGIGGLTSIFKGGSAKIFFRFTGILVIMLGLFNILNSWNLLKVSAFTPKVIPSEITNIDTSNLEVQEITIRQLVSGYDPKIVYIQPGKKIKLTLESTNPYSCSSRFIVPSVGINKQLEKGTNSFEFVAPSEEGTEIPFSCIMGMYTGKFIVK